MSAELIASSAFACNVPGCAKRFAVRSNMTRHMKTHGDAALTSPTDASGSSSPLSTTRPLEFQVPLVGAGSEYFAPRTLRWVPESLTPASNIETLRDRADRQEFGSVSPRSPRSRPPIVIRPGSSTSAGSSSVAFSPGLSTSEEDEEDEVMQSMPVVSMPLPPVVPSSLPTPVPSSSSSSPSSSPRAHLEERNSYIEAPPYPYHPSCVSFHL
jgi:hypothetical protein